MGTSALFTGDMPVEVEEKLIRDAQLGLLKHSGVVLDSTEILKVGHHGSSTSTSEELLSYLNVETAVISCGKDNLYKHPSDEVINRLTKAGVNVYRTDERGNIIVTMHKDGDYTSTTVNA